MHGHDHNHNSKTPSAMAEMFGRMSHGDAGFFVVRRLDMRGAKVEGPPHPVIHSAIHNFFYLTEGEALMNIGDELYLFKAGECASIPAGQTFSVHYFDGCVGYMGGFSTGFVSDNGVNPMQVYGSLRRWGSHKVMFDEKVRSCVSGIFERLCSEFDSGGSQRIIKSYLALLLTEIEEASENPRGLATGNNLCNRFIESVFVQCDLRIPVSDYAARLDISPDYLQKVVKRFTGKPPVVWIREAVILEAKALLLNSGMAVSEISGRVGVDDPSYFSRLFKRQTGLTPIRYRKQNGR